MKVFLSVLMSLLFTQALWAKCISHVVEVSGTVFNATGITAPDALVGVSWLERGQPAGPALTRTATDGTFKLTFHFNAYSGASLLGADECKGKLSSISLAAYGSSAKTFPLSVPVGPSYVVSNVVLNLASKLDSP